jgi:hypothetical protein
MQNNGWMGNIIFNAPLVSVEIPWKAVAASAALIFAITGASILYRKNELPQQAPNVQAEGLTLLDSQGR